MSFDGSERFNDGAGHTFIGKQVASRYTVDALEDSIAAEGVTPEKGGRSPLAIDHRELTVRGMRRRHRQLANHARGRHALAKETQPRYPELVIRDVLAGDGACAGPYIQERRGNRRRGRRDRDPEHVGRRAECDNGERHHLIPPQPLSGMTAVASTSTSYSSRPRA
jgi:hypothetical protein